MPMAAELRQTFSDQGFVISKGVLPAAALEDLRRLTDDLTAIATRNNRDLFTNYYLKHRPDQGVLYDLCQRHPRFAELAREPGIVEILRQIYAVNFYLYENSLVYKPRSANNAVPWHQDFMSRPK